MTDDDNIEIIKEKLRDALIAFLQQINESGAPSQDKTSELLSVIAGQIIEVRFCLEEIKKKL